MLDVRRGRDLVARADRGEGRKDIRDAVEYLRSCAPLSPSAAVRARLNAALRNAHTLTALRAEVIQLSSALEDAEREDEAPPTERAPVGYPMPWEGDAAPSTPRPEADDTGP